MRFSLSPLNPFSPSPNRSTLRSLQWIWNGNPPSQLHPAPHSGPQTFGCCWKCGYRCHEGCGLPTWGRECTRSRAGWIDILSFCLAPSQGLFVCSHGWARQNPCFLPARCCLLLPLCDRVYVKCKSGHSWKWLPRRWEAVGLDQSHGATWHPGSLQRAPLFTPCQHPNSPYYTTEREQPVGGAGKPGGF